MDKVVCTVGIANKTTSGNAVKATYLCYTLLKTGKPTPIPYICILMLHMGSRCCRGGELGICEHVKRNATSANGPTFTEILTG